MFCKLFCIYDLGCVVTEYYRILQGFGDFSLLGASGVSISSIRISGLTILFIMCVTFLSAVFRLKCATNRALRGGWGCFLAGVEPFVERLAGEDAADRLVSIFCCMIAFSCSVLPDCLTPHLRLGLCLMIEAPLAPLMEPGQAASKRSLKSGRQRMLPEWKPFAGDDHNLNTATFSPVPMRRAARSVPGNLAGWSAALSR